VPKTIFIRRGYRKSGLKTACVSILHVSWDEAKKSDRKRAKLLVPMTPTFFRKLACFSQRKTPSGASQNDWAKVICRSGWTFGGTRTVTTHRLAFGFSADFSASLIGASSILRAEQTALSKSLAEVKNMFRPWRFQCGKDRTRRLFYFPISGKYLGVKNRVVLEPDGRFSMPLDPSSIIPPVAI